LCDSASYPDRGLADRLFGQKYRRQGYRCALRKRTPDPPPKDTKVESSFSDSAQYERTSASITPAETPRPSGRPRKVKAATEQPNSLPVISELIRPNLAPASAHVQHDAAPGRIDKSVLTIAEPRRLRDKAHLKFVASQPCLICGRSPADAHFDLRNPEEWGSR
jgi:hypothetical protein